jgi:hypothetical protein
MHETILHVEMDVTKMKSPTYPLHVAKVPTPMGFSDKKLHGHVLDPV